MWLIRWFGGRSNKYSINVNIMSDHLILYSNEELKKIQQIELKLLKVIAEICLNLGVEYFLIGGTALGAIRHGGFIPWDDDIDIGMTRENYNKFIEEAPKLLPSEYSLQTPSSEINTPYYYTKVRVNNTVFKEYCNRTLNINHGVYIDIFPFDNVPDDDSLSLRQFRKVQRLIRLFSLRQIPDISSRPTSFLTMLKSLIRRTIHCIVRVLPYKFICRRLETEFTRYNNVYTSALACLNFPVIKTEYILKSDLYPLIKHKFEDSEFCVPNNYDKYLTTHYGDYNTLPEQTKRFAHKPYEVLV